MDYPNIRKSTDCPLCTRPKDPGLIICWPCYREHDARTGLDYLIVETLEKKETYLKAQAEAAAGERMFRHGIARQFAACPACGSRTHRNEADGEDCEAQS